MKDKYLIEEEQYGFKRDHQFFTVEIYKHNAIDISRFTNI